MEQYKNAEEHLDKHIKRSAERYTDGIQKLGLKRSEKLEKALANSQTPKWLTPEWLDAIERKYMALARKEAEVQERAGFTVTPEWWDAIERKYMTLAMQEVATTRLRDFD